MIRSLCLPAELVMPKQTRPSKELQKREIKSWFWEAKTTGLGWVAPQFLLQTPEPLAAESS